MLRIPTKIRERGAGMMSNRYCDLMPRTYIHGLQHVPGFALKNITAVLFTKPWSRHTEWMEGSSAHGGRFHHVQHSEDVVLPM